MARTPTTTDAFNTVAEPQWRQILDVLASGEHSVDDLVHLLGLDLLSHLFYLVKVLFKQHRGSEVACLLKHDGSLDRLKWCESRVEQNSHHGRHSPG